MAKRRHSDLQRQGARRRTNPRFLVVCEGEESEPGYIHGFCQIQAYHLLRLKVVRGAGDPLAVVQHALGLRRQADAVARQRKDDSERYEEVWCLFDVDDHERLAEARALAARERIELAVSNPSFELWLLLHFAEQTAAMHRDGIARQLRKHRPDYRKRVEIEHFLDGYDAAAARAGALDERHARNGTVGANPSTGVYRLTERIRSVGRDARLGR